MVHRRSFEDELKRLFPSRESRKEAREIALEVAHDIRKFEINLYWRRTAYFWTLLAAVFAGYFLIQDTEQTGMLPTLISSIGVVVSFGWFLANKGSKFWQENWEAVVEQIEDKVTGPLYKTEVIRCQNGGTVCDCITGPEKFSVSRINQLAVGYVVLVWVFLLGYSVVPICPLSYVAVINVAILAATVVMMIVIYRCGKSSERSLVSRFTNRVRGVDPCSKN